MTDIGCNDGRSPQNAQWGWNYHLFWAQPTDRTGTAGVRSRSKPDLSIERVPSLLRTNTGQQSKDRKWYVCVNMSEGKHTHINKCPFLLSKAEGCCSLASDKASAERGLLGILCLLSVQQSYWEVTVWFRARSIFQFRISTCRRLSNALEHSSSKDPAGILN